MPRSFKSLAALCAGFCGPLLLVGVVLFGALILAKGSDYARGGGGFSLWPGGGVASASAAAKDGATPPAQAAPNPATALTQGSAHANVLPWPFQISAEYGHYPNGDKHWGLDLDATYGVIQTAPVGGIVEDVLQGCVEGVDTCGRGWGNHVWWKSAETGHHILLAHFSKLEDWVQVGATVRAGQPIGVTGATGHATGPHTHIQVNLDACCSNDNTVNPAWEFPWLRCDPEPVLKSRFGAACP